jgi:broad specificity phosphatase PhoE
MKLILVRHGEAENNVSVVAGGQLEYKLTENGIEQAKKLAERLKDEKIAIVFSSPLSRAKDTAKEIVKLHPKVKIVYDNRLKEMNFGELEGKSTNLFHAAAEEFKGPLEEFRVKGGESYKELIGRVKSFIKGLEKYHGKTVLVVSHGRTIRAILHVLLSKPLEGIMKEKFYNTSVTILELKEGKFGVIEYNCAKHLR